MRTTVTLDPDTERLLRKSMRERGLSFKQAINEAIRMGLVQNKKPNGRRFVQKTYAMGSEQLFRWDKALTVAENLEDEELSRKLSLRK